MVVLRDLILPQVIGRELDTDWQSPLRGHTFAANVVDSLIWLHRAEAADEPLWQTVGGDGREIACGEAIGRCASIDELLTRVENAVVRGVPRVKLKIAPGWDVEPLRALRDAWPSLPVMVDANGAYTLADLPVFRALDSMGLVMIEQPLHYRDLADHAALQARLDTPLCLDESITCLADAERALRLRSARIVNLKPGRLGGVGPTIGVHDRCRDAGVGCWLGGMLETGLGTAIGLALATLPNCLYPADLHPCGHHHDSGILRQPLRESSPHHLRPANAPGLGVEVDPVAVARWTVEQITVG
jgi:O-succinylbenzoate synthase